MEAPVVPSQTSPFNVIRHQLIVSLPANLSHEDVDWLENCVLRTLGDEKRIRGVIVDFASVHSTDFHDLARLNEFFLAIHLLGRTVSICGVNPGLAAVVVRSGQQLYREYVGIDIDDVLQRSNDA